MKHTRLTDQLRERAALYALDALAPLEARAFTQHLDEGCAACRGEAQAFETTAAAVALGALPLAPRPEARTRLLDRARALRTPVVGTSPFTFALEGEGTWVAIEKGVFRKDLTVEPASGNASYLIRMEPGARVGGHRHAAREHCYAVAGDLHIAGRHLHAGDYHLAAEGSTHEESYTDGGCLLLIVEHAA